MSCLSRIEIQEFIDDEMVTARRNEVSEHLAACDTCAGLCRSAVKDRKLVRELFGYIDLYNPEEPLKDFTLPLKKSRKKVLLFAAEVVAAACIAVSVLFLRQPPVLSDDTYIQEYLFHQYYEGKDLNKLWHEKDQQIILRDDQGVIFQTFIIN